MTKQRPDYSRAAGGAALGARLRRLSERLDRDATRIERVFGAATGHEHPVFLWA